MPIHCRFEGILVLGGRDKGGRERGNNFICVFDTSTIHIGFFSQGIFNLSQHESFFRPITSAI